MSDDKPKVISLQLRRIQQLKNEGAVSPDSVIRLADEITKLLGEQHLREAQSSDPKSKFAFACDQLLAAELSINALLRVLEHTLGPGELNAVLVDVESRKHYYSIEDGRRAPWPAHERSDTYLDHLPDDDPEAARRVKPFKKKDDP